MSKTLSSQATTAADNPHVDIIRLMKIEFSGLTLYLCDRVWGDAGSECVFDSQLYEPLILSWGSINHGRIDPITYDVEPSEASVVIDNNTPVGGSDRFTALFSTYDPHYTTVSIYEIFEGASASADKVDTFKGKIEDLLNMSKVSVTLRLSGYELSIVNQFTHIIVDTSTYPGADPDDIGKMLPQAYGSAKKVPFMAVDAGGVTTLAEDLDSSETTIDLTDSTVLPAAGTVQIDSEQITYTGNTSNQLTGCTRAVNATTAVAHDLGATVAEIQSDYFYIIGHAVKAFDAVYVYDRSTGQNVKQSGNYTAYTGQTGDEHASYPGKACIKFTTLPIIKKQVNIATNDTIGVDTGSHDHDATETIVSWIFDYAYKSAGTANLVQNLADGSANTSATIDTIGSEITVQKTMYEAYPTPPTYFRLKMIVGVIAGRTFQFAWGGQTISTSTDNATVTGSWTAVGASTDTWAEINALSGVVSITAGGNGSYPVKLAWVEFKYTPTASASPATGVAKTGTVTITGNSVADTVIGGRVCADIQGWQDDGAGTYTGVADALIERPDHILKHILGHRCGLTLADVIDSTTYDAAGTSYASNSYVLAFAILQRPNVRELLQRVAYQAKSYQFWEAGVHFLKHTDGAKNKSLSADRIDLNQTWVKYTPRIQIKNTFSGRYNRDWSGYSDNIEADRSIVTATDASSVTKYGTLEGNPYSFPYIPGSTQAQAVLDWIKGELANPRLIVELVGGYYLTDLVRGDIIEFTDVIVNEGTAPSDLYDTLLELVTFDSDQFRIIDMVRRPDAAIQIEMIKI